jgi:hypothetical protein
MDFYSIILSLITIYYIYRYYKTTFGSEKNSLMVQHAKRVLYNDAKHDDSLIYTGIYTKGIGLRYTKFGFGKLKITPQSKPTGIGLLED